MENYWGWTEDVTDLATAAGQIYADISTARDRALAEIEGALVRDLERERKEKQLAIFAIVGVFLLLGVAVAIKKFQ